MLSNSKVDQLGDRLRVAASVSEKKDEADLRLLYVHRLSFGTAYRSVIRQIKERLHLEPSGRMKSNGSIIEKLRRESLRLSQVQDIAGCRLLVADMLEQDEIVDSLRGTFSAADVMDRRETPSHGYRAVHVIVPIEGKRVEIQVRTHLQHTWAQLSEAIAAMVGPSIKYGGGSTALRVRLDGIAEVIRQVETMERAGEDVEDIKSKLVGQLVSFAPLLVGLTKDQP